MKVNTKSWHYKVYSAWLNNFAPDNSPYKESWHNNYKPRPENFCHYFRVVTIYMPVIALFAIGVISGVVGGAGILVYYAFTNIVFGELLTVIGVILLAAAGIAAVCALLYGLYLTQDKAGKVFNDPEYEPKSIVVARLKAKKSKVCPKIEFEDAK